MGPWSAGTTSVLLADSAGNDGGASGQSMTAKGGPGALAEALASAAMAFGAQIRTGAEVDSIITRNGRAVGVALTGGEELHARAIITAADPKRTLTELIDPVVVGPHLSWRAANIRTPGAVSKVNLALSGLPAFAGADSPERLAGRIVIGPSVDYLERAFDASKFGRMSDEPFLEATIPTISDPTLAPEGQHVMSIVVQWTPYRRREGDWDAERDHLADVTVKTMERFAPGLGELVTARQVITPTDLAGRQEDWRYSRPFLMSTTDASFIQPAGRIGTGRPWQESSVTGDPGWLEYRAGVSEACRRGFLVVPPRTLSGVDICKD